MTDASLVPSAVLIAGQSNAEGLRAHLAGALAALHVPVPVMDASVGGSVLVAAARRNGNALWLADGFAQSFLQRLARCELRAVWWVQGESEALYGPVTAAQYTHALLALRALLGCKVFMVSPIAAPHAIYPHSRSVLAAQYRCCAEHGFVLGPEYYDLEHDREHLTEPARVEFARRAARILAQLI